MWLKIQLTANSMIPWQHSHSQAPNELWKLWFQNIKHSTVSDFENPSSGSTLIFDCHLALQLFINSLTTNIKLIIIVAFVLQYPHYQTHQVYVWAKCKVPEVLLHIPALTLVPLVQKPQDALLKRLSALILRKLQGERMGVNNRQDTLRNNIICLNNY